MPIANKLSKYIRRDGPITPSIYKDSVKDKIEQGLAFYKGIIKQGSNLQTWNNAKYIDLSFTNTSGTLFTIDAAYN
jgi:hypothetical protein